MIFTNRYKRKLDKGARMINEANNLYLKGDKVRAERIKSKLRKIKGIDVMFMIHRARTIREG